MLWIIGAIVLMSIVSALATTTPAQRAESRARLARWNPLFIAITILCLGIMFWPWWR
jgi:hypothetical protein